MKKTGLSLAELAYNSALRKKEPPVLTQRCPNLTAGDVVLLHERLLWPFDALPRIVTSLHANGYECVTMHDLFAR